MNRQKWRDEDDGGGAESPNPAVREHPRQPREDRAGDGQAPGRDGEKKNAIKPTAVPPQAPLRPPPRSFRHAVVL